MNKPNITFSAQTERHIIEYKRELTEHLEREVVSFLNYSQGGTILIGANNDGSIYGLNHIDQTAQDIKNRLRDNICPTCLGLFDIQTLEKDGKQYIKLDITSGLEQPYYLRKFGMTPQGCTIRIGTAIESLNTNQIEMMYSRRIRNSLRKIESPRNDLTFAELKIYYEGRGYYLNENFTRTLNLLTEDGKFNYTAYLLADDNGNSLKFAKYAGKDRTELIENEEYGYSCLIKSYFQIESRLKSENKTFVQCSIPQEGSLCGDR